MKSAARPLTLLHRRTSQRYPLRGDLVIGRATGDLVFDHDPKLSSKHCLIRSTEDGPAIYDLKSRTGVFVNGAHLPQGKACLLKAGCEITVGDQAFSVQAEEDGFNRARLAFAALAAAALTMALILLLVRRASHEETSLSSRTAPSFSASTQIETDARAAIARFDEFTQSQRQRPTPEAETLATLERDFAPAFTRLESQWRTLVRREPGAARRFEARRRETSNVLSQVQTMIVYLKTKDPRHATKLSGLERARLAFITTP